MNLREIYAKYRLEQGQAGQAEDPHAYEVRPEDLSALYFLDEILTLRHLSLEDLREIHKAKFAFPGQRLIQEGADT